MEERNRVQQIFENIDILIHTMRLHHRIVEKRIDGLGVHHGQHRMLMKVSTLGTSASQKALAAAMDVSPAAVARMLKQLSAEGLIEKAEGADGRCNEVSLLPAGRQVVEDSRAIFRAIDGEMFEGITAEEMDTLRAIMARVRDNLVNMERGGPDAGAAPDERSEECR